MFFKQFIVDLTELHMILAEYEDEKGQKLNEPYSQIRIHIILLHYTSFSIFFFFVYRIFSIGMRFEY